MRRRVRHLGKGYREIPGTILLLMHRDHNRKAARRARWDKWIKGTEKDYLIMGVALVVLALVMAVSK